MNRVFKTLTLGEQDAGRRLDRIIRKFLPNLPLALVYKALRTGRITLNGKKTDSGARTAQNDVLFIEESLLEQGADKIPADGAATQAQRTGKKTMGLPDFPYEILFKNEHLLIINKPYDTLVHGGSRNSPGIESALAQYSFSTTDGNRSLSFTPAPLHRLDRKTSGILVCSQSLSGARCFSRILHDHLAVKHYLAIISGILAAEAEWTDLIEKEECPDKNGFYTVQAANTGKKAITRVVPLAAGSFGALPVTLARFTIITGRTHQIRLQSALHGFPLLGDSAYARRRLLLPGRDFFLHACSLSVPENNEAGMPPTVTAPPGNDFDEMCKRCLLETDFTAYNN